ncbi:MAG TPA: SEC-C metal-binding domain-containing protein [Armatimonadota bacterium]|nr:SEC-C metal-binding domain-containing protein [Armatimonadota bacterium]
MDVIGQGDFAVSSDTGKTLFSFRHPSGGPIDFVPSGSAERSSGPKVGRNDPCPCGSGRKYKKCCGRSA